MKNVVYAVVGVVCSVLCAQAQIPVLTYNGVSEGDWFASGERFAAQAPNPSATARRALTLRVRLAPDGAPGGAAFTADGAPVSFQGLEPEALLQWLALDTWGALVVTSRGGAENASAEIRWFADGLVITVR